MFRNQTMQRSVAAVVLSAFVSLSLYPLTAAAQAKDAIERAGLLPKQKDEGVIGNAQRYFSKLGGHNRTDAAQSADERFGQLLNDIHEDLKAVAPQTAMSADAHRYAGGKNIHADNAQTAVNGKKGGMDIRAIGPNMRIETERGNADAIKPLPGADVAARVKNIRSKASQIKSLYPAIEQSFQDTERHLKEAKLPQAILNRHTEAVAQYATRKAEFEKLMSQVAQAADSSTQQAALADLGSFMAKYPNSKPHQYTDPNKLPFRSPGGKVRAPFETKAQFQASLFPPKYDKIMLAGAIPDGLQLAQATLPQAPGPADTAETEDVQITQAIKDQVALIGPNPVKLYNWVRNNIAFIPSYGSIQGSDMTLQNRRGNAIDTASLLIAMYRAAGVPARYVYGTIELSSERTMNWVGGVTKPEAALSLLGQGGIPSIGVTSGGTIKTIRLEHVWVEAYVDYTPSRGAVNKNPNTWVPVDPSFKQYQFTQGMDIKGNVPLNVQSVLDQTAQGAVLNGVDGYVQNLNQANLQAQLTQYQTRFKTYIDSQKIDATMGDVLGSQKIVPENFSIMMGTLPYKTITTGNTFQTLPDNLRWKFKTNIYAADGISDGSSPIIELNQSTPKLAGKKITLSFMPATQADQDLVNSYLPKPHADGTPIQPSELPSSLPGYLLNVKAEFRVEGQVIAQTTQGFTMGSAVKQSNQYFNPAKGGWDGGSDNDLTVGEYNTIGLDLQGVSYSQLASAKLALFVGQQNFDILKATGTADILHAGISGYFASVDANALVTAKTFSVVNYRAPSYGRFFVDALPQTWFGITRSVSFPGVGMDVDYLSIVAETEDFDKSTKIAYVQQVGSAASASEHSTPEKLFTDPTLSTDINSFPKGVSAVKAIAIAHQNGQPIYLISNQNVNGVLPLLNLGSDVKQEIADAIASGKEVMTHQNNVQIGGWVGSGYTLIDPETGAGAYKIAGGSNGGVINFAVHVAAQPSLILPPCAESYLQTLINNFLITNSMIPGVAFPTGAGLLTAKFVADASGGATFLTAIKLTFKNPLFLLGNLRVALIITALNFLIMSFVFELGILVGSAIGAAFCNKD